MSAVVTSIDSATGGVLITWSAPYNGGASIDAYKIQISDALYTGAWYEDTACDGTSSTVIAAMQCIIPMSTIIASPYSFVFD
jgi:hypothetical protein